jgi:hypothetical protein
MGELLSASPKKCDRFCDLRHRATKSFGSERRRARTIGDEDLNSRIEAAIQNEFPYGLDTGSGN